MRVRQKVALELSVIAVLTTVFLVLFARRSPFADMALAGFALLCLAALAHYTKKTVWAASPPPVTEGRWKRCLVVTLWVTVPTVLLLLMI